MVPVHCADVLAQVFIPPRRSLTNQERKRLDNLVSPWETAALIWELRIGEYRVFYDVSDAESVVYVRAVRRKPPGTKTEDIL
jgi:hypothetical protein